MSAENVVIVLPKNEEQTKVLKAFMKALHIRFQIEKPYKKEFVEKLKKSKQQFEKGDFITISKKEINQLLD